MSKNDSEKTYYVLGANRAQEELGEVVAGAYIVSITYSDISNEWYYSCNFANKCFSFGRVKSLGKAVEDVEASLVHFVNENEAVRRAYLET